MPPCHRPSLTPSHDPRNPSHHPPRRSDRTGGAAGGTLRPGPAAPSPACRPSPPAWTARRREGDSAQLVPASTEPAPKPASHPAGLGRDLLARAGCFCDNQRGPQRGPAPGTRLGRSGARRLRWRGWAKEIKKKTTFCRRRKSPLPNPWEKFFSPSASRTALAFRPHRTLSRDRRRTSFHRLRTGVFLQQLLDAPSPDTDSQSAGGKNRF
ncbi:uncharacterized protein LOC129136141 [Pan troglodytes]|uniref:uncharacterized protein LOC129136141 n=1 Tax=Pan troglodytes TaxID=9598 RepID=UPI00051239EA|nr:uncharacterized protein LOC129136141 [Pan troglodytes]